jgi:hypothetical protein
MRTIEEINRMIQEERTAPIDCVDAFLEHVVPSTFETVFAQLDPKLQEHVIDDAMDNIHFFEDIIAGLQRRGIDPIHWIAFRDWAHAQPWAIEARQKPKPQPTPMSAEEAQAWVDESYLRAIAAVVRPLLDSPQWVGQKPQVAGLLSRLDALHADVVDRLERFFAKKKTR